MEEVGCADGDCAPLRECNTTAEPAEVENVRSMPLEVARDRKAAGNESFRAGNLEDALRCYGQAIAALEAASCGQVELALRASIACNQALCLLRLGQPTEAEERAAAALAADPSNSKASYRRGLARLELGDTRGALEDLQKASRLEPQNKEVRQKCEEARRLVDANPVDEREVAMAINATSVIGNEAHGGSLYSEKLDLNEGRIADTYKEQRDWIKTIKDWSEIKDVAFADEDRKSQISVYMTLPGIHEIAENKVCVWMTANSLEVRVIDLKGSNWCYVAQELWGPIDHDKSTWKVKQDKLTLKLQKRASARSWDRWEKLRRI